MSLSSAEATRIEAELIEERRQRVALWRERAPELDLTDPTSRDQWIAQRQAFFTDPGPIPADSDQRSKLRALKDRYRGERIFVIGNGPSLNRTPLHLLENEFTFGVNRIYLLFDRIGWRPTFYTTLDWRVAPDCFEEINALAGMQLFFPERFHGLFRDGDDVTWYWNDKARHKTEQGFASDASLGIRGAGSVTGAAIQLAFHMGFDPIYLIGCDVSYSVADTVIQEGPDRFGTGVSLHLTSTLDDDANHFDKRYFGAGKRWHDPNVQRMIEGFTQCRDGATRHGRTILNATVGGQLEVFERVEFRSLFARGDLTPPTPSLAAFIVAALSDDHQGLMVDVGAGSGAHLSPFGALGWEVRCFEPCAERRQALRRSVPTDWNLFVDPRALDTRSGPTDSFRVADLPGISLTPLTERAGSAPRVDAATPSLALEPLGDRVPDVVAIDANNWENEILGAWPFDTARPTWLIVGVDDRTSPRFGFSRRSVADTLQQLGYGLIALEGAQIVDPDEHWLDEREGAKVTFVGVPAELSVEASTLETLVNAHRLALELADDFDHEHGGEPASAANAGQDAYTKALEAELAEIRTSTSWQLGSGIVQRTARVVDAAKAARSDTVGRLHRFRG